MIPSFCLLRHLFFFVIFLCVLTENLVPRSYAITPERVDQLRSACQIQGEISFEIALTLRDWVLEEIETELRELGEFPPSPAHEFLKGRVQGRLSAYQRDSSFQNRFIQQFRHLKTLVPILSPHRMEQRFWEDYFSRNIEVLEILREHLHSSRSVAVSQLEVNRLRALDQQLKLEASLRFKSLLKISTDYYHDHLWSGASLDRDHHLSEGVFFGRYPIGVAQHQGFHRNTMEDVAFHAEFKTDSNPLSSLGVKKFGIFGVLDGHGGAEIAQKASLVIPKIVPQFLQGLTPLQLAHPEWVRKTLENSFSTDELHLDVPLPDGEDRITVDDALRRYCLARRTSERRNQCLSTGSTALIGVWIDQRIYLLNLGDSRAILLTADQRAQRLSFEHKPDDPGEWQEIRMRGGFVTSRGDHDVARLNGYLAMSRALGDWRIRGDRVRTLPVIRKPEVTYLNLDDPGGSALKALILVSDGITDGIPLDQVLTEVISSHLERGAMNAARELVALSVARGSTDNLSAFVLDLTPREL